MKKILFFTAAIACLGGTTMAQVYAPINTTNYNLDAIAENTTAVSTTGGVIDGSNNVMYSAAYASLYAGATGLPNSGLLSAGTRTYQLQTYTVNNTLYLPAFQADTINLVVPAPYPSLSLLAFATEGTANINVKVRFTDGTSQSFNNMNLPDWFTAVTNTIITGFDRVSRPTGTPGYSTSDPRMSYYDLNLSCANRVKNVQRIIVQNNSSNARACIMAVAGTAAPTYSTATNPVTCAGGTNGTATVSVSGGVPPLTFSWSTVPSNTTNVVTSLPTGVTTYSITDAANCTYTAAITISQSLAPTPPLTITPSAAAVCVGNSVTLTTSGASTYTWSNNSNGTTTTVTPVGSGFYSVAATTTANCSLTGTINLTVNALPTLTFNSVPPYLCLNNGPVTLTANPGGGTFTGNGISFGSFYPTLVGASTQTLTYNYTDANGCSSTVSLTTVISSPTVVVNFTITPPTTSVCSPSFALNATPAGGTYVGQGVVGSSFSPTLAGIGTRTVSYTYTDANNCSAKKVSSITVTLCATTNTNTGFAELSNVEGFEIYPNPSNGSLYIKGVSDMQLNVMDQLGRTVKVIQLDATNEHKVYIENLSPGIYFLMNKEYVLNKKIIVTGN